MNTKRKKKGVDRGEASLRTARSSSNQEVCDLCKKEVDDVNQAVVVFYKLTNEMFYYHPECYFEE